MARGSYAWTKYDYCYCAAVSVEIDAHSHYFTVGCHHNYLLKAEARHSIT